MTRPSEYMAALEQEAEQARRDAQRANRDMRKILADLAAAREQRNSTKEINQ